MFSAPWLREMFEKRTEKTAAEYGAEEEELRERLLLEAREVLL